MRSLLLFLVTGFLSMGLASVGRTHGGRIEQKAAEAIVLETFEDSGAPMKGAIVAIYTPGDSVTPWKTGTTDAQGQFMFIPDRNQPGEWTAQVRLAGHGHAIAINIPASNPVPVNEPIASVATDSADLANSVELKNAAKAPGDLAPTDPPPLSTIAPGVPVASQPIFPETSPSVAPPSVLPNTPLQQGLLVGSVVWGFVGTGLFFSRRSG